MIFVMLLGVFLGLFGRFFVRKSLWIRDLVFLNIIRTRSPKVLSKPFKLIRCLEDTWLEPSFYTRRSLTFKTLALREAIYFPKGGVLFINFILPVILLVCLY